MTPVSQSLTLVRRVHRLNDQQRQHAHCKIKGYLLKVHVCMYGKPGKCPVDQVEHGCLFTIL